MLAPLLDWLRSDLQLSTTYDALSKNIVMSPANEVCLWGAGRLEFQSTEYCSTTWPSQSTGQGYLGRVG